MSSVFPLKSAVDSACLYMNYCPKCCPELQTHTCNKWVLAYLLSIISSCLIALLWLLHSVFLLFQVLHRREWPFPQKFLFMQQMETYPWKGADSLLFHTVNYRVTLTEINRYVGYSKTQKRMVILTHNLAFTVLLTALENATSQSFFQWALKVTEGWVLLYVGLAIYYIE